FFVVLLTPPPPACTLFPYTTLFRSWLELGHRVLSFPCRLRMLSGVGHASASFRVERQAATRRSVSASASTSESCWPFWPPSTKQPDSHLSPDCATQARCRPVSTSTSTCRPIVHRCTIRAAM